MAVDGPSSKLEAVFLCGIFLPYTAYVLKSAAIPDSASVWTKDWRAFTVKLSSGTVYRFVWGFCLMLLYHSCSATDALSPMSLFCSPCCRKYHAGFCLEAMNFASVERLRSVSCQPEAQICVYQSTVIPWSNFLPDTQQDIIQLFLFWLTEENLIPLKASGW